MGSPLKVQESRNAKMSRLSDGALEELLYSRNTPLSRQPEDVIEVRYADGKAD
jgi:hypothetical protein